MKKKEVNKTKEKKSKKEFFCINALNICDNCDKEFKNLIKLKNGLEVCERCYDIYYQEFHKFLDKPKK